MSAARPLHRRRRQRHGMGGDDRQRLANCRSLGDL